MGCKETADTTGTLHPEFTAALATSSVTKN